MIESFAGSETEKIFRGEMSRLDFFGSWQRWTLAYLSHPEVERRVDSEHWQRLPVNPKDFSPPTPPANSPAMAPSSLLDASGRPTRVKIPAGPPERPISRSVRHPLRDLRRPNQ